MESSRNHQRLRRVFTLHIHTLRILFVLGHFHLHLNLLLLVFAGLEGGVGGGGGRGLGGCHLVFVVVHFFLVLYVARGRQFMPGVGQLAVATHGLRVDESLVTKVASIGPLACVA